MGVAADINNMEITIINSPLPGVYRLKTVEWRALALGGPAAIAVNLEDHRRRPNAGDEP